MSYRIEVARWSDVQHQASMIRRIVFIQEQHIPEQDEWDEQDAIATHFVVYDEQDKPPQAIATARLLTNHSVGRVAVLSDYRSQGVGRYLMLKVIEYARTHAISTLTLSSQQHAIAFYERLGFIVHGKLYLDCGIPHQDMVLQLNSKL